jgi:signal transduction histidine kinase
VETDGVGRYPADLEAAVYFCCLEALQNVGKHAGEGARASLSIREEAGSVLFLLEDDGAGFDPALVSRGAGFTNMSDRLGAIGGQLEVESEPGRGTRVRGSVPVRTSPPRGR